MKIYDHGRIAHEQENQPAIFRMLRPIESTREAKHNKVASPDRDSAVLHPGRCARLFGAEKDKF